MQQLGRTQPRKTERVIQFGGGNFLRAFFDWQLQQMNDKGLFDGSAVIVQPIATGLESTLMPEQDYCYTVISRGLLNGERVDNSEIIHSVSRSVNPYADFDGYLKLAEQESLEFIVSNTTEAGIAFDPNDKLDDAPPASYPGKLTALLYRRYQIQGKGFTIIPCELIEQNGKKLKECVLQYAALWNLEEGFRQWIETENVFCDSLVDRIVPGYPRDDAQMYQERHGYEDKLMVVCEPYMIWVIQGPKELEERLPLKKAGLNVVVTDEMPLYRERKVHILNGPHTAMSALGILGGVETVGDVMADADYGLFVERLMEQEIIPALSQPQEELKVYAESIKERFRNPFLVHRLDSIMLNAFSKYRARNLPVLEWYVKKQGKLPEYMVAALAALIVLYRADRFEPKDDEAVKQIVAKAWENPQTVAATILADEALWGKSLLEVDGLEQAVQGYVDALLAQGARAVLKSLNEK